MTAPAQRIPQLMLFLTPTGEIHCEVARGGGRRRVELPSGVEWLALRAELLVQRDEAQRQFALASLATKTEAEGRVEFQASLRRKAADLRAEAAAAQPKRKPAQLGSRSNFSAEELGI